MPADKCEWLEAIAWNDDGLVPVIAQELGTGQVLMLAWMNRDALQRTVQLRQAVYWSRSRGRLWRKGESSGHVQHVEDVRLDCDGDAVLMTVRQEGGIACHTGRHRCFYRRLHEGNWETVEPVLKAPEAIYGE